MSDSVGPHRQQPTRLPSPWDSPGKNTGVGCHFLLQCKKVKSESEAAQLCLDLATPWTAAYQAPLSMGLSRQEYWNGLPLPSPMIALVAVKIYILQGLSCDPVVKILCFHCSGHSLNSGHGIKILHAPNVVKNK